MTADVETLTRRIGKEIFARVGLAGPTPFSPAWWDDQLMELSMSNDAVKFQMFRFVDVLPQLQTPAAIVRHLREYFAESADHLPAPALWALRVLPTLDINGDRLLAVLDRLPVNLGWLYSFAAREPAAIETVVPVVEPAE